MLEKRWPQQQAQQLPPLSSSTFSQAKPMPRRQAIRSRPEKLLPLSSATS